LHVRLVHGRILRVVLLRILASIRILHIGDLVRYEKRENIINEERKWRYLRSKQKKPVFGRIKL